MVDKLEACPFCGGEAKRFTIGDDDPNNVGGDVIACTRCQASSHVEFGRKENLVSCWNRRTPANGEQVERALKAVKDAARYVAVGDGYFDLYGSAAEAVDAAVDRLAATLSTPTEDARSRVKVLEEALERLERVMRENIHENDGPDRIMLDGQWHEGPLAAWAIRCFRKVGEIARTALGKKETDR